MYILVVRLSSSSTLLVDGTEWTKEFKRLAISVRWKPCDMTIDISTTMRFEEYKAVEHPVPYVLQLESDKAALLYYGASHVYNPADPMFADIESRFTKFQPRSALVEGGIVQPTLRRDEIIRLDGERGFLCWLCQIHNVPFANLEPSFDDEVQYLLKIFAPEQLLVFYFVRQIVQYRRMESKPSYEEYASVFAGWIASKLQIELSTPPLEFVYAQYKQIFGDDLNWQALSDEIVNPLIHGGLTNEISRQNSYVRDAFHVVNLLKAAKINCKVFAIAGASHVVMQERTLRAKWIDSA